jgi:DNA-binding LacI/PurR family transcriptional regulator
MAQRKDVSIQNIADRCGVSIATVSRVLNGDRRVAVSTRQKVIDAMEEYGYQPAAVSCEIKKVGIVIDTQVSDYYMALVVQLHDAFAEAGIQTITASLGYHKESLPDILRTVYDSNVCGVVLISCDYLSVRELLNRRLPHVWIDCNDPPEKTENICQVQSDQYVSGVLAAQELYRHGSLNPILLAGFSFSHRLRERFNGFCAEYAKYGIEISEKRVFHTPKSKDALTESKQLIRYLISSGEEFDGVFAVSDWRALGAYLALTEAGIKVPNQVRIIGYDGVSVAGRTVLNIAAVQQIIRLIAESAADLLLRQMEGKPIPQKRIIVPTGIFPGQTV